MQVLTGGGNKDGNCFGIFPPAMEMQNAFYELYGGDGHFLFPCLRVRNEFMVNYSTLLLWVL